MNKRILSALLGLLCVLTAISVFPFIASASDEGVAVAAISYEPGDANGDGAVNGKDVTLIRRYNASWDVEINLNAADANGDGAVNGKDVTLIRRYNASWDVTLVPGTVVPEGPTAPEHEHELTYVDAKDATCSAEGVVAHWVCETCEGKKYFALDGSEITAEDTVVAKNEKNHNLVFVEAKDATCSAEGIVAHWHCADCDVYYAEDGVTLIDQAATVVAKLPHTEVKDPATSDKTEGSHCGECGEIIVAQQPQDDPYEDDRDWDLLP